jgi:hypothetical protein
VSEYYCGRCNKPTGGLSNSTAMCSCPSIDQIHRRIALQGLTQTEQMMPPSVRTNDIIERLIRVETTLDRLAKKYL